MITKRANQLGWVTTALTAVCVPGCMMGDHDTGASVFGEELHRAASPRAFTAPDAGASSAARYVILVIGDAMSLANEVAASRYLTGTDYGLSFHAFPEQVSVTTWDVTGYNQRAEAQGKPTYAADSVEPRLGYDPDLGGAAPTRCYQTILTGAVTFWTGLLRIAVPRRPP